MRVMLVEDDPALADTISRALQSQAEAQVDWTGWTSFEQLAVRFPARPAADQVYALDWDNSLSFRLGAQWQATPTVAVRAVARSNSASGNSTSARGSA